MPSWLRSVRRRAKRLLRPLIPERLRRSYVNRRARDPRYSSGSPADVFSAIYRDGIWGSGGDFYSGEGSHDPNITRDYLASVSAFIGSLPSPPAMVDLGCGDFAIGAQLRALCSSYVACDVVPELIARNQRKFADRDVTFKVVDLVADDLPGGDVACIRQVLQHLSNDQIAQILPKLQQYRYVIITEHLPGGTMTAPNLDKSAGPSIRTSIGSGVVLEAPPFNLGAESRRILCDVPDRLGVIRTTLWVGPQP